MKEYKIFDKLLNIIDSSRISQKTKTLLKIGGFFMLILILKVDYSSILNWDLMGNSLKKQRDITRELNRLRAKYDKYGCTYVSINLFHNGTISLNGTHFTKMSRIYEGKRSDKDVLTYKMKGFDVYPFNEEFLAIDENLKLYIPDASKYKSEYLRGTLDYYKCKSVLYVAIHERNFFGVREFVGFMTYEFENTTNFDNGETEAMRTEFNLKLKELVKS